MLICAVAGCARAGVEPVVESHPSASASTSPSAAVSASASADASLDAGGDAAVAEISARHILVRVGDFPNGKKRTLKQATDLIADVKRRFDAGEDFAELARKYSEDPGTARLGGDLGSFPRGKMVKDFDDAVFALAPYEATVVVTVFGVHLVQRTR